MDTTKTYRPAAEATQSWATHLVDELPDLETVKAVAGAAAQRATSWAADASDAAANRAGEWLEDVSESAADWIGEASSRTLAMVPAIAAKRARRRRWVLGSLALIPLVFFLDPKHGPERRAKVKSWFRKGAAAEPTSMPSFSQQSFNDRSDGDRKPEPAGG